MYHHYKSHYGSVSQTWFCGTQGFCKKVSAVPREENAQWQTILLAELAIHTVYVSGETISLLISLKAAVYFLHVMYIKDK
jgi:hypothetical protein